MTPSNSYSRLLTSLVYVLIFWQMWAGTIAFYDPIFDSADQTELCKATDGESEQETEKNEKDEKSPIELGELAFEVLRIFIHNSDCQIESSVNHPDIITPPPENFQC